MSVSIHTSNKETIENNSLDYSSGVKYIETYITMYHITHKKKKNVRCNMFMIHNNFINNLFGYQLNNYISIHDNTKDRCNVKV